MINVAVLDENREKMSKSKGNVVTPEEVLDNFPVDAARYWAAGTSIGDDFPFKEGDLEAGEKLMRKLWNASKLVEELAPLEQINIDEDELDEIDRWMLAELDELVEYGTEQLEEYSFSKARDRIRTTFWNTFCDNYLEIAKQRLEDSGNRSAEYTLQEAHKTFLKLFAPFLSHITEELWQEMHSEESIHTQDWPEPRGIDADIDAGETAMQVISALRKHKTEKQLALNEEIEHVQVYGDIEGFEDAIKEVMHVQELEILEGEPETEKKVIEIKLDYSEAGPKYGDKIGEIEDALENNEWNLDAGRLEVAGEHLKPEEFEVIEDREYKGEGEMFETEDALVVVR